MSEYLEFLMHESSPPVGNLKQLQKQ